MPLPLLIDLCAENLPIDANPVYHYHDEFVLINIHHLLTIESPVMFSWKTLV